MSKFVEGNNIKCHNGIGYFDKGDRAKILRVGTYEELSQETGCELKLIQPSDPCYLLAEYYEGEEQADEEDPILSKQSDVDPFWDLEK